jgi:hypothetical protein
VGDSEAHYFCRLQLSDGEIAEKAERSEVRSKGVEVHVKFESIDERVSISFSISVGWVDSFLLFLATSCCK